MPRRLGATAPITALVFGALNTPFPAPRIANATPNCPYGTSGGNVTIQASAPNVAARPKEASPRDPILSESRPAIGENRTSVAVNGSSLRPAITGESPATTWKYQ